MKKLSLFVLLSAALAASVSAIDDLELRVRGLLAANDISYAEAARAGDVRIVPLPGGGEAIARWNEAALGPRPEDSDLPTAVAAQDALDDYRAVVATNILSAGSVVPRGILPTTFVLAGAPLDIPSWALGYDRASEAYAFFSDAELAARWGARPEYTNLVARNAAAARLCGFVDTYGDGESCGETNLQVSFPRIGAAFTNALALSTNLETLVHAASASEALQEYVLYGGSDVAEAAGLHYLDTNCLWLSTGPYRSPQ